MRFIPIIWTCTILNILGAFELVHDLDLAIWFAGQEIDSVQAVYGSYSDMGMESPDIVGNACEIHRQMRRKRSFGFLSVTETPPI